MQLSNAPWHGGASGGGHPCATQKQRWRAAHGSRTPSKLWGFLFTIAPFLFFQHANPLPANNDSKYESVTNARHQFPFNSRPETPKSVLAMAKNSLETSSAASGRGLIEIEEDCDLADQVNGGNDVPRGEFQYFTAILDRGGSFRCSGVLIGRRYVLSAGHCGELERDTVLFADVGYRCPNSVNCGYLHERIEVETVDYAVGDLALLTLAADAPSSIPNATPDIKGKHLKKAKKIKKKGGKLVLVGGGRTDAGSAPIIQMISLQFLSPKTCTEMLSNNPQWLREGYVCSFPSCRNESNTNGPCQGDSGGPIIYINPKGRDSAQVVAVHAFGRRFCGNVRKKPDGHFTVAAASDMIRRVVCQGNFAENWCGKSFRNKPPVLPLQPPTPSPMSLEVTSLENKYLWTFSAFLGGKTENPERENSIASLSFRPTSDGSYILAAAYERSLPKGPPDNGETIKVFDAVNAKRRTILSLAGHVDGTKMVKYHPTQPLLASASASLEKNEVKIWDADSGSLLYTFPGHEVVSFTYGSHARLEWLFGGTHLAYYAGEGDIKVWNMAQDETQTLSVDGHVESYGFMFAFHKDGDHLILAGGAVIKVVYFDPVSLTVQEVVTIHTFDSIEDFSFDLAYSPDYTKFAVTMLRQVAYVFDSVTFELLHTYSLKSVARPIAWHPSSKYIAVGSSAGDAGGDVYVWRIGKDEPELLIKHGSGGLRLSLAWSLDGKYLVHGSGSGTVRIEEMLYLAE